MLDWVRSCSGAAIVEKLGINLSQNWAIPRNSLTDLALEGGGISMIVRVRAGSMQIVPLSMMWPRYGSEVWKSLHFRAFSVSPDSLIRDKTFRTLEKWSEKSRPLITTSSYKGGRIESWRSANVCSIVRWNWEEAGLKPWDLVLSR